MDENKNSNYIDEETELRLNSRIMNLVWTISGNYDINYSPDTKLFMRSEAMCLYDAIKQGAFAKYYDRELLSLYILKKLYKEADYEILNSVAQMAVESACRNKIEDERAGVFQIREKALDDMVDLDFKKMAHSPAGRMKLALIHAYRTGKISTTKALTPAIEKFIFLENESDTMEIIKAIDEIYNHYFDNSFEKNGITLEDVMNVPLRLLVDNDWSDILNDELYTDNFEQIVQEISASLTNLSQSVEKENTDKAKQSIKFLNNQDVQKMNIHVENTFGKSYLSEQENKRLNYSICKGISSNCKLHFTDGILSTLPKDHYRYKYAQSHLSKNKVAYFDNHRIVKRNIAILTGILKNSLILRSEKEMIPGDSGKVNIKKVWKIGRANAENIFDKIVKRDESDFVVDILIDASGSQSSRQGKVALQAFILSESLSEAKIPHRIMSYCTFWEYTVLRRFRDYDSPKSANAKIFEYMTSSNNRDGLAIKAICESLLKRDEEHKILIVLSDGRPNDINLNNPNDLSGIMYTGEAAIKDTAHEVRNARMNGISVLGVFAGSEEDLAAEKLIFGKDFAYIKNISNFSNVVGLYLVKQIEE